MDSAEYEKFIRSAESGLLEIQKRLGTATTHLAQAKDQLRRARSEEEKHRLLAGNLEDQAIKLLKQGQEGRMPAEEADRLASQALVEKQDHDIKARSARDRIRELETETGEIEAKVRTAKDASKEFQNEVLTLKARARSAAAAVKVGEVVADFDPFQAETLLARMWAQVQDEEALAEAYGDLAADPKTRLDAEIEAALGRPSDEKALEDLERLKKNMKDQ